MIGAINAYLRAEMSLSELRAALLAVTLDHPDVPEVAHEIEYFADETASGNLSERELAEELLRIVRSRGRLELV